MPFLRRAAHLLLLLLLTFPLCSQEDSEPYFGLNSNQTFAEGDSPTVGLWATNVRDLTFRVYRVEDPIAFFSNLEEPHRFGGRAPRLPAPRTTLESFHRWKIRSRNQIRNWFRGQYTTSDRAAIRAWIQGSDQRDDAPRPAQYAQLPVLNSRQLVSSWTQPVQATNRWQSATVPIPVSERGLYLVEAVSGELSAHTIVLVSNIALTAKVAHGDLLGLVAKRQDGQPVVGATLHAIASGRSLASWSSDELGLIQQSLADIDSGGQELLLVAIQGADVAATSIGAWVMQRAERQDYRGYIYTDRPVYRPGDKVHFKGIVREAGVDAYAIPGQRTARVTVQNNRGERVYEQDHVISNWGTFHGDLNLKSGAPLGYYSVQIALGEYPLSGGFHVEEYRKPEYEVRVRPRDAFTLQGQTAVAEVEARYFFGEPVANASVEWVAYSRGYSHWFRDGRTDFYDPYANEDGEGYFGGEVAQGTASLNAEGKALLRIPLRLNNNGHDERITLQAKVRDSANREIAGGASFVATYGSFHLSIQKSKWVFKPGEEAEFRVQTRRYEGEPVQANVTVTLERRRYENGSVQYTPLRTIPVRTGADGSASGSISLPESGSMALVATTSDAGGRRLRNEQYLWVSGDRGWSWTESRRIEIIPDKGTYQPGDTAEILIIAGAPGVPVLVTVEAGRVYRQEVIPATDGTVRFRLPVEEEYAPNVFVSASFLQNNQYYSGSQRLSVPASKQKLDIRIDAPKQQFSPGEKATIEVTALDWQGKPAANTEISLGVVDEAIYAVRQETLPDLLQYFHGNRYNQVYSFHSMDYYFSGEAGKRRMQLAQRKRRQTLAELKGERYVDPKVRKYFPDTALWLADVHTDEAGKARAEITYPDALTTWRTTARGVTRETQVGSAVDRRIVRKNLILRLGTPRFLTAGDEVEIPAIVMNYLDTAQRIRTTLRVEGLELISASSQEVDVPARGEAVARYRVRATAPGEVTVTGQALGTEESDALELQLPVRPFGIEMLTSNTGSVSGNEGEQEFTLSFPEDAIGGTRSIDLQVSPSVAASVFSALEYLTSFPYGCMEQTMSSFLPSVIVSKALDELNIRSDVNRDELAKKVNTGIAKLLTLQHSDGGWGWWATDESQPFMTAYVLYGLEQARQAGYNEASAYKLTQARNWLRLRLLEEQNLQADQRAFMAYALLSNGQPDPPVQGMVHAQLNATSSYGSALAGLALQAVGDARANDFVERVERSANDGPVYWQNDSDNLMGITYDSSSETTAFALKLLLATRPDSPLIPGAVEWLVANRSQGRYWGNTKTTAMVIFGLTDYLKKSGELKPNLDVEVFLGNRSLLKHTFTAEDSLKVGVPTLRLDASDIGQENRIRIIARGEGRAYWQVSGKYFATLEGRERAGTVGLNLLREYFSLRRIERDGRAVYRLAPMPDVLQPGDLIAVRLTVTGNDWRYLMIEDPIPAGAEFIDRRESIELESAPPWWSWDGSAKEYRDDRAAIFQYEFDRGQRQFTHLLRVVNPGLFHVSPAQVQPMYQTGYQATTGARTLRVAAGAGNRAGANAADPAVDTGSSLVSLPQAAAEWGARR